MSDINKLKTIEVIDDKNKRYIGDGVYITLGSYKGQYKLYTDNGMFILNTIYIESEMVDSIVAYIKKAEMKNEAD